MAPTGHTTYPVRLPGAWRQVRPWREGGDGGAAGGTRLLCRQRRERGAPLRFGRPLCGEAELLLNEGSRLEAWK